MLAATVVNGVALLKALYNPEPGPTPPATAWLSSLSVAGLTTVSLQAAALVRMALRSRQERQERHWPQE
jgi:hypothetical protein